ncbi:hypothetical protein [Flavobacterium pectinovorum]|nr:hypothetical protein [Flavobacterium pectinovorum]
MQIEAEKVEWYIVLKNWFFNNSYIIFLSYSSCFLIFYLIYYFNSNLHGLLLDYADLIDFLKTLCILSFTAGIFTVTLKYFQYLKVFEGEFNRIINSQNFESKLQSIVSTITFSEDFLNKQGDLTEIWKKVTLIKYKKEFPELYYKIEKNIKNNLFENNSLDKYYKNVQISYEFELAEDNKTINVKEFSSFTIVRNSIDDFFWEFFVTFSQQIEKENNQESVLLIQSFTRIDDEKIDLKKCIITNQEENENFVKKKYSYPLGKKKEYHIERCFQFSQIIEDDRIVSFSSSHVVDDLTVRIKLCKKLQIVFEPVGDNLFNKENIFQDRICYVNRDVFLPGEKYKIFLYRTHDNN